MSDKVDIVIEINDGDLYLRKISKYDIDFFYESLKERDITGYLSLGPLRSLEHSKRLIKSYLKSWDRHEQFNYIIELRHNKNIQKIGSVSLWNISWLHGRSGVGIWLLPEYWNKGIGKMVLNLIKNIVFIHLKLHRIEAHVAVENTRSINLFTNSNFLNEGRLASYLNIDGKYQDAYIFACFSV
jgi:ribosomal-protein-alanine N-acetyltransferase